MADSRLALSLDLASARVLVWLARFGRDGEFTPEAHRYFFDRYSRLAELHRTAGRRDRAARLQAKADEHYHEDGGPYAAAMAMPRPRAFVRTNAVASRRLHHPDDAA